MSGPLWRGISYAEAPREGPLGPYVRCRVRTLFPHHLDSLHRLQARVGRDSIPPNHIRPSDIGPLLGRAHRWLPALSRQHGYRCLFIYRAGHGPGASRFLQTGVLSGTEVERPAVLRSIDALYAG